MWVNVDVCEDKSSMIQTQPIGQRVDHVGISWFLETTCPEDEVVS